MVKKYWILPWNSPLNYISFVITVKGMSCTCLGSKLSCSDTTEIKVKNTKMGVIYDHTLHGYG